uniref:uncharacterized protein LOC123997343 n=1 Tax=Oncorhynchus gorbuscha TaxID=8017 RepID=UPI001EAF6221|nr:uncharacterized protein LOC123997343 [Oncorhynchus gorbuscha]
MDARTDRSRARCFITKTQMTTKTVYLLMVFIAKGTAEGSESETNSHQTDLGSIAKITQGQWDDEEGMDAEDQEQEKNASKGALKITIHVLKSNEPERVCKTHWKKVPMASLLCANNLKSHLKKRSEYLFEGTQHFSIRSIPSSTQRVEVARSTMNMSFLLSLSLESNPTLLRGLPTQTRSSSQSHKETVEYIKENPSPEKCISLHHCRNELNDHLVEEIQRHLGSGILSKAKHSPAEWSALVFVLLTSEMLDIFDLRKYSGSEGLLRMLPVVKASRVVL